MSNNVVEFVNKYVTRELVDDIFGAIISKHGGWNHRFMPMYIDMVCEKINALGLCKEKMRKEVIKKLKELDPILFKKV